jgi:hypothetical protein
VTGQTEPALTLGSCIARASRLAASESTGFGTPAPAGAADSCPVQAVMRSAVDTVAAAVTTNDRILII